MYLEHMYFVDLTNGLLLIVEIFRAASVSSNKLHSYYLGVMNDINTAF